MATDTLRTETPTPIVVGYDGGAECCARRSSARRLDHAGGPVVVVG